MARHVNHVEEDDAVLCTVCFTGGQIFVEADDGVIHLLEFVCRDSCVVDNLRIYFVPGEAASGEGLVSGQENVGHSEFVGHLGIVHVGKEHGSVLQCRVDLSKPVVCCTHGVRIGIGVEQAGVESVALVEVVVHLRTVVALSALVEDVLLVGP